jgi:hypothetical protein
MKEKDKREMIDKMRESHRDFPALKVANLDHICISLFDIINK